MLASWARTLDLARAKQRPRLAMTLSYSFAQYVAPYYLVDTTHSLGDRLTSWILLDSAVYGLKVVDPIWDPIHLVFYSI